MWELLPIEHQLATGSALFGPDAGDGRPPGPQCADEGQRAQAFDIWPGFELKRYAIERPLFDLGTHRLPFDRKITRTRGSALEFAGTTVAAKTFWVRLGYVGIAYSPVFLFLSTLQLTGQEKHLKPPMPALLWGIPLTTIIAALTNNWHHLIWTDIVLSPDPDGHGAIFHHGSWFWVHVAYAYVVLVTATVLFSRSVIRHRALYRWQAVWLLLALFPPWLANIFYVFDLGPVKGLDFTPAATALTGLLLAVNFLQFRFLDLVPIARDHVIEGMGAGMLALDLDNRIVDIPTAAQTLFALRAKDVIGKPVTSVLASWLDLVQMLVRVPEPPAEIHLEKTGYLELWIWPLYRRDGQLSGQVVILQDITERKEAQLELQQAHDRIEQNAVELRKALDTIKTLSGPAPAAPGVATRFRMMTANGSLWSGISKNTPARPSPTACVQNVARDLRPRFPLRRQSRSLAEKEVLADQLARDGSQDAAD